ncbi:M56 family metallopeptidase [Ulvibacter antarcticus]|uniref:Beta-lactamase regulating signal transducer with metallopeptidase domain n=1 Tax=Ulvibacter antarcticus TaxID=442714 RepID=A0A3L9YAU6_9FLAO|nr:M56 family metallopeptidase [Ulvibacter antarcticus]RMA57856.1 beta-lactamase regulating signal transducer with metallopeptidase domain [Ulvibacter antarcticus]
MEVLIYLGKSAFVLALFYLIYVFLLRKETFFNSNRHFLLIGIPIALIIPFVEFIKTIYIEIPEPIITKSVAVTSEADAFINTNVLQHTTPLVEWWQIFLIIYFIGVCIMLIRFIKQLFSLFQLLNKQDSEAVGTCIHVRSKDMIAPFSFFNYIIYNPKLHSREELTMILEHEQIHAGERHSIDILIVHLLLVFQWWNPLAWAYKRAITDNLEFIADRKTVPLVSSARQYQLALVRNSSPLPIPALTNNFYQSISCLRIFGKSFAIRKPIGQVKKRIVMLNKHTSNRNNSWKLAAILPLLAVFLWSFNVKEVEKYREDATASDSSSTKILSDMEGNSNAVTNTSVEIPQKEITSSEASTLEKPNSNLLAAVSEEKENPSEEKREMTAQNHKQFQNMATQEIRLTISKETTREQLETMKKDLESKGFSFDYSNVSYNSNNEITSISISYKDANGNAGNYSVNSDNPINTIVIQSNGNSISVRSSGNGDYSYKNDETMEERMQDREKMMEERKEVLDQRREEMNAKRKEMRTEANERRKEMRYESNDSNEGTRKEMQEEMEVRKEEMKLRQKEMQTRMDSMRGDHVAHENHTHKMSKAHEKHSKRTQANLSPEHLKHITKDDSDADLDALVNEFNADGISFSYGGLKRNEAGEITKIKLKLDNNNGSVSKSTYDRNGNAIGTITVGSHNGTTVMKGSN